MEVCALRTMARKVPLILLMVVFWSCGDSDTGKEDDREGRPTDTVTDTSAADRGEFDRASFVFCPALEDHRAELASIVGFEQDGDRPISAFSGECALYGDHGAFVRVSRAPSVEPSIAFHVSGLEADVSSAPQLGPDAVFVDDRRQPHVVFSIGPLIIDVDAKNVETPSRETMIQLASRVREILVEANK